MGLVQIGGEIRSTPLNQNFQYLDGKHLYGDDAAKPSPAQIGRLYVALDTGIIYADIGTAWIPVGGGSVPAHASTHATGGSDPLTPADIGAASQVDFDAHKADNVLSGVHGMGSIASQDYETGIWTPDLRFGGNADGLTYSVRSGVYTRLGRLVDIKCTIVLSNKGTSVGTAEIYGLPFQNLSFGPIAFTAFYSLIAFPADGKELVPIVSGTQSKLELRVTRDNVTHVNLTDTSFANNSGIQISGTYYI